MTRKKELWFRIVFSYFCTRFEGVCDDFLWKLFQKDYQKYLLKKEKGVIVFSRKILFPLKKAEMVPNAPMGTKQSFSEF